LDVRLSQVILVLSLLLFAVYVFRVRSVLYDRAIFLLLTGTGVVLVIWPDLATAAANAIGIGRGSDLLLYVFIIGFLFGFVNVSSGLRRAERQITEIVRAIAIENARQAEDMSSIRGDNHEQMVCAPRNDRAS